MNPKVLLPSSGPDGWRRLLTQPERQWASGYSARATAHAWEAQAGWPPEIADLLRQAYGETTLVLAIPERKTPLPGGRRESQSDVFALGKHAHGCVACTVEGKVNEPFGPTVAEQMKSASPGKRERLAFLCSRMGLSDVPGEIHYQLLHRTVAALLEAETFGARDAAMIVHSFAQDHRWFEAFARFVALLGGEAELGRAIAINVPGDVRLTLGWASGSAQFLIA